MSTQSQAVDWLNAQVGQYRDYDSVYQAQCVDMFDYYYEFLTGRNPLSDGHGVNGAKDLWYQNWADFDKVPDSSSLVPQPGDVLIYNWATYGHVEMCVGSDANGSTVVGNNLTGNPSLPVQKTYRTWARMNGLLGVLRPRFNNGGITGGSMATSGNIEKTDVDLIRIISSEVKGWDFNTVHSGAYDQRELNAWVGQPIRAFITGGWQEKSSEDFRNRRNAEMANYAGLEATIASQTATINDLNLQLTGKQAEIADLQDDVASLKTENEALKKALADAQQPIPPTPSTDQVVITKDSLWTTFIKFINKIRGV